MSISDGEIERMNAVTDIEFAYRYATTMEAIEAERLGIPVNEARSSIARRLRAAPGTLENIRRKRTKIVPSWLMERIRAEFVRVLQSEINRLEHEISLARQTGADHRDDVLAAAQAQVAAAKDILRSAK